MKIISQKTTAALLAVLLSISSTALADPPILISAKATRTTTGMSFTAKWNPNTTGDVFPQFFYKPADNTGSETGIQSVPAVIRGIKPAGISVTAKATGLTKGKTYQWRAVAGGNETTEVIMADTFAADFVKGTFQGAVTDGLTVPRGAATVTVTAAGSVTGSIGLLGLKFPLGGKLDNNGQVVLHRTSPTGDVYDITIASDSANNVVSMTVQCAAAGVNFSFDLHPNNIDPQQLANHAGTFTQLLKADSTKKGDNHFPQGEGAFAVKVDAKGKVRGLGKLADGTTVTFGSAIDEAERFAFYAKLASPAGALDPGYVAGQLLFQDLAGSDADGLFAWRRAANLNSTFLPSGFEFFTVANASRFTPLVRDDALFLILSEGNIGGPFNAVLDIAAATGKTGLRLGVIDAIPFSKNLKLSYAKATGIVMGSLRQNGATCPVFGAVYQKSDRFGGFFTDGVEAGRVATPSASEVVKTTFNGSGLPIAIPDDNSTGVSSNVSVSLGKPVVIAKVSYSITHAFPLDLRVKLQLQTGLAVTLPSLAANLNTTGLKIPQEVGLIPSVPQVNWNLNVADVLPNDTGTFNSWSLELTTLK